MRILLVAASIVSFSGVISAQNPKPAPNPLASVKSLRCSFPTYAATRWQTDASPATVSGSEDFSFSIEQIDIRRSRARIVAGAAFAAATAMLTETSLNVIEPTPLGNLMLTSVFIGGREGTKYLAIHSRHVGDLDAAPTPSQHFGSCTVTN